MSYPCEEEAASIAKRMTALSVLALGTLAATVALAAADAELRGLLEAGRLRRARSIAQQRLASNPGDAEALYAASLVKYRTGDLEGALPLAEKAVNLQSEDAEYHHLLAQIYGSQAQQASVFRQIGLAKKCRKELDITLALDPKHFDANVISMVYLLKAPGMLGGDKTRARSIPDEIARYSAAEGHLAKARLLREEGSKEDLTDLYRKAAEADPKNLRAQISYADWLLNRGQNFDEIERRARLIIDRWPDRVDGYAILAARYASSDRWGEMDSILRDARQKCPDNLYPQFSAATILLKRGKEPARAEAYVNAYLAQEPELAMPDHAAARRLLALVLEKQGRKADAIAELEKAIRLKPGFADAKSDLKRLQR